MYVTDRGLYLRSNPNTWVDGAMIDVDRSFLKEALGTMRAPVVRELVFHAQMTASGVTATLLAKDGHKFFNRIQVLDRGGMLFDCSGAVARQIEQLEIGNKAFEPNNGVAIASGATSTAYHVFSRVIFDTERAHRGADTALPLNHLFDGGGIRFRCGSPPGGGTYSGTVRVYAVVHDEREPELKSRQVWQEYAITKSEDNYAIGGSLRAAFISSVLEATGYTALDTEVATITSKTLQMYDLDLIQFILEYRRSIRNSARVDTSGAPLDSFLTSYTAPEAVSIVHPSQGQHIGKMPDLSTLHLKLVTAPTSGVLVTCKIEDRNLPLAAETMGYDSVPEFEAAVEKWGKVSRTGQSPGDAMKWNARLCRRLPMTIQPG